MTNEQILKKAIEKARKNGWKYKYAGFNYHEEELVKEHYVVEGLIFSHDFAKAFWGEEITEEYPSNYHFVTYPRPKKLIKHGWKYHLQQMVLEEDPIKYLEKFL